ncbi:MAG: hypothetical protein RMM29_09485 [Planctomycetota bacterium]|nr:hypothetical protein [Planctomycetota bacterium]MCX8040852.1 hypothetical protein [Planctomycetota bacterium]MDW8373861.1 hypothetical protein [Planctomycetota bacterium]
MRSTAVCLLTIGALLAGESAAPPVSGEGGLRAGVRTARDTVPSLAAMVRLGASWDSNALLDHDPDRSHAATAVYASEAALTWRPWRDAQQLLQLQAQVGYDRRPHLEDLDTLRCSVSAVGAQQVEQVTLGAALSATRLWQSEEGAAAELRGGGSVAWMRLDHVDIFALELALLHIDAINDRPDQLSAVTSYGDPDPRSGLLTAAVWRHWWRWDRHRLEGALRLGRYNARAEDESYVTAQPWAALRLRPEEWEIGLRVALDARQYASEPAPATDSEQSLTFSSSVSVDRHLAAGLWLGGLAAWSNRWSDVAGREYERWQAGVRLTWNFPSATQE